MAVAVGRQAVLLWERDALSVVVVRRIDISSGRSVAPDVLVGSSAFGDLLQLPPAIADDGRTISVLRDTTVLPIDRRSGRSGPAIDVDDDAGFGPTGGSP